MNICRADLYWLRIPLQVPYENAIGRISDLDALLVKLEDESGNTGWGEACPIKGYSPESPSEAWEFGLLRMPDVLQHPSGSHSHWLASDFSAFPFMVSAVREAVFDLMTPSSSVSNGFVSVPVIGIVNSLDVCDSGGIAQQLVASGHRTLKLKVGYDVASDVRRVQSVAAAIPEHVSIRLDANQSYSLEQAMEFARALQHVRQIEFFEQPVDQHDWTSIQTIAATGLLPIMLDESIYDTADIHRAAGIPGVAAVKLKMSKAGGPEALGAQINEAKGRGLGVVIGNGVASDIGCHLEVLIQHQQGLALAGEMNGFDKLVARLTRSDMHMADGKVIMRAGRRCVDQGQLGKYMYKHHTLTNRRSS